MLGGQGGPRLADEVFAADGSLTEYQSPAALRGIGVKRLTTWLEHRKVRGVAVAAQSQLTALPGGPSRYRDAVETTPPRSDSAIRRAIRREWETGGRPPCPICRTPVGDDEVSYASQAWKTVIHRLCSTIDTYSPVTVMIVAARTAGLLAVEVPTVESPGCKRAAREVGLGTLHQDVTVFDDIVLDRPMTWYEPPKTLLVDVARSFREGRIAASPPPAE